MDRQLVAELEDRLVRYVQIDTQSDESSASVPSTAKQYDLLNLLLQELQASGAPDARLTEYGVVLATLPATVDNQALPTIAFLAHVDTAPAFSGAGVKPIVHRAWDGQPIVLPDDPNQRLSPETSAGLAGKMGEDIVTASGTTLLGADDKAGVAIAMALAAELMRNPHIPHGPIRLCFTPDEEIGRGVHASLPRDLAADVAYTLDGGRAGSIECESFSADKALVTVTGHSTHTGAAKGKMVNALNLAAKILETLPHSVLTPETSDGRQGFIHCYRLEGTPAKAELHLILRDFELEGLAAHGQLLQQVCQVVAQHEPRATVTCCITPQYRNMRYWLEQDMRPAELARQACRQLGIEPFDEPIRGGTDGSRLTELGVPTPNLFTGMQELHGPLEWISLQDMAKATQLCLNLVQLWAAQSGMTNDE